MKKHGWVFTLNNYSIEEAPFWPASSPTDVKMQSHFEQMKVVRRFGGRANWVHDDLIYIGYGREKASTGTKHLQGLLVFNKPVGLRTLKRLNGRAHFQPMLGTFEEAKLYASKENYAEWQCHSVENEETFRVKVEEDHYRAKVIADEETTILTLTEKVDKLTTVVTELIGVLSKQREDQILFEKKIQTNFLSKDKFI